MNLFDLKRVQDDYFDRVESRDVYGARSAVLGLLEAGMPLEQVVAKVLSPAQVRVGGLWERGAWSVADEHGATEVTEATLKALAIVTRSRSDTSAPHIVVACAEGERHTLPTRMAAAVADTGRAHVTVLGPWLSADHFDVVLSETDVDLLALSCTMPSNLVGAAKRVDAAHRFDIPVLAGGRGFGSDPARAYAIGADAWASHASGLLWPLPRLAGRKTEIPYQALRLEAIGDDSIELALDRVVAGRAFAERVGVEQVAHPDNLRCLARSTAAAMVTNDPTILDKELSWLVRLPGGTADLAATMALVLAEVVWSRTQIGSTMLQNSAACVLAEQAMVVERPAI